MPDWHDFHARNTKPPAVVDPRRRMRICLGGFAAALLVIFGRAVQLEVSDGEGCRAEALRPIERKVVLPAARGRILARDGTVLARDRTVQAVAVDYRWLQDPPDERWLTATAKAKLPKIDRKNPKQVAIARADVLKLRNDLFRRLVLLCKLTPEEWTARARRIQMRVERIADHANRRRQDDTAQPEKADDSWAVRVRCLLLEEPSPPRIVVAEELKPHVVVEDVPEAVVAEIEHHRKRYPGVKIVTVSHRNYPGGTLAAHVLGQVGHAGVERQYDAALEGHAGVLIEQVDRSGHVVRSYRSQSPSAGSDVVLTLDARLQRTAEELLQSACERSRISRTATKTPDPFVAGGAIAVMDAATGAVLAAASAPTFDANLLAREDDRTASLLADPAAPLFNRVSQMAIPPGSSFKTATALALLESDTVDPSERFACQGYLHQPERQRCELFVRQGIGHGELDLADALAVSCNVYFFHFAERMGARPLLACAEHLGFGRPTGIDLPGEAAGSLPSPESFREKGREWRTADTQAIAIGQGNLTATPLQVLRMMAAVANGGLLVVPHIRDEGRGARDEGRKQWSVAGGQWSVNRPAAHDVPRHPHTLGASRPSPHTPRPSVTYCLLPIASPEPRTLNPDHLAAVREGLRRAVADAKGTAHATVHLDSMQIAGKTGTAETGGDRPSHAWFVGYAPAEAPRVAFVIALEHAGDAATAAGPVAKRLVVRMQELGIL